MKVSTAEPFQLIYSLYQHEYLGYLFESFVIQVDEKGRLTLQHQNISSKNASEFGAGMDDRDYELIKLMDQMQQEAIVLKFYKKKIKPAEFFFKFFDKETGDKALQETIAQFLEIKRARILELLSGKMIFEMGRDGEPAWRKVEFMDEKAKVLFHFRRNDDNTHYFPTIKHGGERLEWQYNDSYLICYEPAWLIANNNLYSFAKGVDGKKLKPFLTKKFIVIPKKVEATYYEKFVTQLVASFDVYAKGFEINTESYPVIPQLTFSELVSTNAVPSLFESNARTAVAEKMDTELKILFRLQYQYGEYTFSSDKSVHSSVKLERIGDEYIFHKVKRDLENESRLIGLLSESNLNFKNGRVTVSRGEAFSWMANNKKLLENENFILKQTNVDERKYFIGESQIDIEVKESIDWFDIHAMIKFGDYEIPFDELRQLMSGNQREITLPNGEIAVIPDAWFVNYSELFAFMENGEVTNTSMRLKKHHLALIQDLENGNLAQVSMDRKLQKLKNFESIDDYPISDKFVGVLRPYQQAGYNWMQFLSSYKFGGCLADDMGLGKTVRA